MAGETKTTVRLYYLPRLSLCGPRSWCCGPIGLSEELLQKYVRELETNVAGARVETVDVSQVRNRPVESSVISECIPVPVCARALGCCQAAVLPEQKSGK